MTAWKALMTPLRRRPTTPTPAATDHGYAALTESIAADPEEQAIRAAMKARRHDHERRRGVEDVVQGAVWRSIESDTHTAL